MDAPNQPQEPSYQLPQTPQPPATPPQGSPPVTPPVAAPSPQRPGFFSVKTIALIIVLVLLIGGGALGYFVFPEPFYNYVGKYLGLSAPGLIDEGFYVLPSEDTSAENTYEENVEEPQTSEAVSPTATENLEEIGTAGTDTVLTPEEEARAAQMREIFEHEEQQLETQQQTEQTGSDVNSNAVSGESQTDAYGQTQTGTRKIPRPRE